MLKESQALFHQLVPFLKREFTARQFKKSTFHLHQNHWQHPGFDNQPKLYHLIIYSRILPIHFSCQMMMQLYLTYQQLLIRRQSHLLDIQRTSLIILYLFFLNILSFSFYVILKFLLAFLGCIIIDINFFELLHQILLSAIYQLSS